MGNIITVVAVLLTHMLIKAVAIIKPPITATGLVPTALTVRSAILRCNPQRCIASAIINPPMNKKIRSFAYGDVASSMLTTPKIGNSAIGKSAVAGSGRASVTHHVAIKIPTAIVITPPFDRPPSPVGSVKYASTASAGPRNLPTQARVDTRSSSTAWPCSGTSARSRLSRCSPIFSSSRL